MSLQDRLSEYLDAKSLTFKDFEKICGLSNGTAARLRDSTRKSTFDRIANSSDLNIKWLLTGEGDMLMPENRQEQNLAITSVGKKQNLIPFYDAETTGGSSGIVSSSMEVAAIKGYIDGGGWFNNKETAAIRHVGASMIEYPDGCVLVVRQVLNTNLLVPGRNYVIETEEYRVTKRLQLGSSDDTIALYSTNTERYDDGRLVHEPFEVDKSDIRRIFSILGYVVNQSGELRLVKT